MILSQQRTTVSFNPTAIRSSPSPTSSHLTSRSPQLLSQDDIAASKTLPYRQSIMQKALRINTQRRKQLAKKAKESLRKQNAGQRSEWLKDSRQRNQFMGRYMKEEKQNRIEDWKLGPLAPNRDVGRSRGLLATVDSSYALAPGIPKHQKDEPRYPGYEYHDYEAKPELKFKGTTLVGNILVGDRVCVIKGDAKIKGLIGYVKEVISESECVRIANVGVADIKLPTAALTSSGIRINTMELPIPMTDIRLVAKLTNAEGETKDVLVNFVHADGPYIHRREGSNHPAHTRYISGTKHLSGTGRDLVLEWPDEEIDEQRTKGGEDDTGIETVVENTWSPVLDLPPLGYEGLMADHEIEQVLEQDPLAPYTLGTMKDTPWSEQSNLQRAGTHGFLNYERYLERRMTIAKNILAELRPDHKAKPNQIAYAQTKLMEDARALWYESRTVATPAQEMLMRKREEERRLRASGVQITEPGEPDWVRRRPIQTAKSIPRVAKVQSSQAPEVMLSN